MLGIMTVVDNHTTWPDYFDRILLDGNILLYD